MNHMLKCRPCLILAMLLLTLLTVLTVGANGQTCRKWKPILYSEPEHINGFDTDNSYLFDAADTLHYVSTQRDTLGNKFFCRTTDGGQNWHKILDYIQHDNTDAWYRVSHPFPDLIMIIGYTYVKSQNNNTSFQIPMMIVSRDSGATWKMNIEDFGTNLSTPVMLNSSSGLMGSGSKILATADAWEHNNSISAVNDLLYSDVLYYDASNIIISGIRRVKPKESYDTLTQIMKSRDYGDTWDLVSTGIWESDKIKFIDSQLVLRAPGLLLTPKLLDSLLHISSDGGRSWVSKDFNGMYGIDAVDSIHFMAASNTGINRSSDGGKTWQRDDLPFAFDPDKDQYLFMAFKMLTPRSALAMGKYKGTLCKLTDEEQLAAPRLRLSSKYSYDYKFDPKKGRAFYWTSITGANRYRLQIVQYDSSYSEYAWFNGIDTRTAMDTIITDTTFVAYKFDYRKTYYARVKAVGSAMESDWSNAQFIITQPWPNCLDRYPVLLSPTENGTTKYKDPAYLCVWKPVESATSYSVEIARSLGWGKFEYSYVTGIKDTSALIGGLIRSDHEERYYIRVKAYSETDSSDWGNTGSIFMAKATGVENLPELNSVVIKAVPNPASNSISITISRGGTTAVRLFNSIGVEVANLTDRIPANIDESSDWSIEADVSALPAGTYFIRATGSKGVMFARLLIVR